jgi:hypothetical protein
MKFHDGGTSWKRNSLRSARYLCYKCPATPDSSPVTSRDSNMSDSTTNTAIMPPTADGKFNSCYEYSNSENGLQHANLFAKLLTLILAEVHIKYEAPEDSNLETIPRSPSLKRRASTDQIDSPEKRQRVEVEAAEPTNDMAIDMQDFGLDACGFDFATLVSDIAASVPQKSHTSEGTNLAAHPENANQVNTASDPANDPSQTQQLENGRSSSSEAHPQHDGIALQKIPSFTNAESQRQKEQRDVAKLQEDPQLSIRILSLPILESLVGRNFHLRKSLDVLANGYQVSSNIGNPIRRAI